MIFMGLSPVGGFQGALVLRSVDIKKALTSSSSIKHVIENNHFLVKSV